MRAPELVGRALEPGERALESASRVSGPVWRALMPAARGGQRETKRETERQNRMFPGM